MPRSDYATCFFFFQKTFVFRKPGTPRVTAAHLLILISHRFHRLHRYLFAVTRLRNLG